MTTGGGNATLTLSGANTFTGPLTIRHGVIGVTTGSVVLAPGGSLATSAVTIGTAPSSGAVVVAILQNRANNQLPNAIVTFNAVGPRWAYWQLLGTSQSVLGVVDSASAGVIEGTESQVGIGNSTLTLTGSGSYSFNGFMRDTAGGSGTLALVKSGTGTQTLSGSLINYTGSTTVNAGRLMLRNATGFRSATNVNSGATLSWMGTTNLATSAAHTIALNNGGTLENVNPANWTVLNGAVTNTGTTSINQTSNATGVGGEGLYLDGGLKGSGTVTINAANAGSGVNFRNNNTTFSGSLVVNGIASTAAFTGSGIGVGGCTTCLTNADITLNGSMELLNGGIGWANGTPGVFHMGALNGTGAMVGNFTASGGVTTVTLGHTNNNGSFSGVIANGTGNTVHLVKTGTGIQSLAGTNTYTGTTTVAGGSLYISGNQSGASGLTTVASGATLGGIGIIGGDVRIADGATLSPGNVGSAPGTLTINGGLALGSGSVLAYSFGEANVIGGAFNDLTNVGGNLTLDGTLNIATSPGGTFGAGVYRIFNYGGSLTNNGLTLGSPSPSLNVQTSVAGQVNLVNTAGVTLNFWDGAAGPKNDNAVDGGDGVWQASGGNDSWTTDTGALNAPFSDGSSAVFMARPGTVTVDNSLGQVTASGMQFANDGYVIEGGSVALAGSPASTIRVGDGTTAGAGYTATIDSVLSGNSRLVKTDLGTLVLTGTNTYGGGTDVNGGVLQIASDANLGDVAGTLGFNNGTLHTTASMTTGRSIDFAAGTGTLLTDAGTSLNLTGALTGVGSLIKGGDGNLLLTGSNTHSGNTTVSAGTLRAGTANVLSSASAYTVRNGATLDLDGHDQTIAALDNAGLVRFAALGATLNVAGSYTGSGGTFALDTALRTDASATDLLRVGGSTAGASTLKVSNAGGNGGRTVEGIKIVDVAGASNGTFALAGDYVFEGDEAVIGGAYAYRLYKNGVSTPTDGDWYLRSSLTNPPSPNIPTAPLYQPGAPLYETYAQSLQVLNGVGSMQQRIGNRYWAGAGSAVIAQGDGPGTPEAAPLPSEGGTATIDAGAIWARIDGAHSRVDPDRSSTQADYDYNTWRLQSGLDGKLYENQSGTLMGGVTFQYGEISTDVSSVFGKGSIDTDGYGFGGTLTWLGQNGFYVDGQTQLNWYDSDITSDTLGRSLTDGNDGFGYALSVETGKRIVVDENWSITPQAQLAYSNVDFDDFTDPFGADVSLDKSDSLKGRLGVSADYQNAWQDSSGRMARSNVYGLANLYHEFLDGSEVDLAGVNFANESDRTWGGVGAGGSYSWADDKYALYGEVSLNTSLSDFADSYSVNGTTGFKVKF
nr:autotransporter outer membrane beta-barrel domain-containing protein [Phyllobacterium sp. KW56]